MTLSFAKTVYDTCFIIEKRENHCTVKSNASKFLVISCKKSITCSNELNVLDFLNNLLNMNIPWQSGVHIDTEILK